MALRGQLLDDATVLEPHRPAWDALAVAAGRPYCAPAWMMSWWHVKAPAGAQLRACVVHEGGELVGIAPFFVSDSEDGGCYGLLGERAAYPIEPVAVPGREPEVAAAVAGLLADPRPAPRSIAFIGVPSGSPWPRLLADHWPGASRPRITCTHSERLPKVTLLHPDLGAWLATRRPKFRREVRRRRRRLDADGARFRLSTLAELDRDLASFARLHRARWSPRGGSGALDAGIEAMLRLAGRELIGDGRFRLRSIDIDGETISSHIFVAAGGVQSYWLGGFDDRWGAFAPATQTVVAAIEDGIDRGEECLELGPGAQAYKYRLSDTEDEVQCLTLAAG